MADTAIVSRLQNSTSPIALLREISHVARVYNHGLDAGFRSALAGSLGFVADVIEVAKERITGYKSATPEAEREYTAAWFEKLMERNAEANRKILGYPAPPKLRPGTEDGYVFRDAKMMGMGLTIAASMTLPGVAQAQLARLSQVGGKAGPAVAQFLGSTGGQIATTNMVVGLGVLALKESENALGITRPVEPTNQMAQSRANSSAADPLVKTNVDAKSSFTGVVTPAVVSSVVTPQMAGQAPSKVGADRKLEL